MRWYLLRPIAALLTGCLWVLEVLVGCLGAMRFFIVGGFSIRYVLDRKRWFEESMLGRRMGLGDLLVFGRWHARSRS